MQDYSNLVNTLPYRKLKLGKDYWIKDNMFPNALEIAERCWARTDWTLGLPWRNETWPGMRAPEGLLPEEMTRIEDWVKKQTGVKRLWQQVSPETGASLSHNFIQVVGKNESGPRPHTDSRKLCRFAGVIYLTPNAPKDCGTSFYRLRMPDGSLGGNSCPHPYANLREALRVTGLPLAAWKEDLRVENVFNRVVFYRADLVHSATNYFGTNLREKRMTVVFFWMSD